MSELSYIELLEDRIVLFHSVAERLRQENQELRNRMKAVDEENQELRSRLKTISENEEN